MSHRTLFMTPIAVLALFLSACDPDSPAEGRSPGDCTDAADDDGGGLFDCADPGCAGAPACATRDAGTALADASATVDSGGSPELDSGVGLADSGGTTDASLGMIRCDPVAQDCTDPTLSKCSYTQATADVFPEPHCVEPLGDRGIGETCARTTGDFRGNGHDTCASGGYCTTFGRLPVSHGGDAVCRGFCASDAECAVDVGERCWLSINAALPYGVCLPTCTLLDDASCPDSLTCSWPSRHVDGESAIALCRVAGALPAGSRCTTLADCRAGLFCSATTATCTALCDDTHPCTTGTCALLRGLPNGAGVCQ